MGQLSNLTSLALARNSLAGAIPTELESLANLQTLKLSGNRLTGCVPTALKQVRDNDLADLGLVDCGVAQTPDLVVDALTVSESAPEAGARFTLNATVRNQGSGPSPFGSTTLRYYQSADSTITTGDTEVGTDSVFRLDASESGPESISLTAPPTADTYYYGACVDAVADEADATNNCSGCRGRYSRGRACPGPGGGRSHGERERPGGRSAVHAQRHGAQPGERPKSLRFHHPALLPVRRLDHHHQRHGSGDGLPCSAWTQRRAALSLSA